MIQSRARTGRLLVVALCLATLPVAAAKNHRVALGRFTTDENLWDSITAATDLTALIEAELAKEPGIEWVERNELGLVQKELETAAVLGQTDAGAAIQQARWNKADWLVTGHLVGAASGRELQLEVIDTLHADVLAEQHVTLPIKPAEPLRRVLEKSETVTSGIREALREAARREQEVAGLPIVAVLFFPDSEAFQRELTSALSNGESRENKIRLLRFPRAAVATEESTLISSGFAEDPSGAWQSIADFYVWGSLVFHETQPIDGEVITDAHTPEITLNVWNGRSSPQRFVEEGMPVERREFDGAVGQQARRLAEKVIQVIRAGGGRSPGSVDEAQRKRMSDALLRAFEEMKEHEGTFGIYLHEPKGRRLFFNLIQTLEAAVFFDPQNRDAQETLVRTRWDRGLEQNMRNRFRFQLGRSQAWGQFVDRFGFPGARPSIQGELAAASRETPGNIKKVIALQRKAELFSSPVAKEYLQSAFDAVSSAKLGNREDFGYPQGVPDRVASDWAEQLTGEVGRRALAAIGQKDAPLDRALGVIFDSRGPGFFSYRDPRKRTAFLDKLWPVLSQEARVQIASAPGIELREDITWTFAELGKPDEAKKLFNEVRASSSASATPPPIQRQVPPPFSNGDKTAQLFRLPAITALPPEIKPVVFEPFEAAAQAGLYRINELALLAGKVWLIGEGHEKAAVQGTNKELTDSLQTTDMEATRLFVFDPVTGKMERVETTAQFTPVGMLAHGGKLWLGLGKDGAAVLDPATGALRRFRPEDGLNIQSAYRLAAVGDRVFLTANTTDMFAWDGTQQKWTPWATTLPDGKGVRLGGGLRQLRGLGDGFLCLTHGPVSVCDLRLGQWKSFGQETESQLPSVGIGSVASDATGFWVGRKEGLVFVDVKKQATTDRLCPPNAASPGHPISPKEAVENFSKYRTEMEIRRMTLSKGAHPLSPSTRLPGGVTAVASDGDFLWVAANEPEKAPYGWSYLMVLHKPTGRWVGQAHADRILSLAVDDNYVWIGNGHSYGPGSRCLRRIEKRQFYDIPQTRWVSDVVSNDEIKAIYDHLGMREQGLWQFFGGEFAAAAVQFARANPQTVETLFLQALCFDDKALRQPERSQAFFRQIIAEHPSDPLAEEVKKQLSGQSIPSRAR